MAMLEKCLMTEYLKCSLVQGCFSEVLCCPPTQHSSWVHGMETWTGSAQPTVPKQPQLPTRGLAELRGLEPLLGLLLPLLIPSREELATYRLEIWLFLQLHPCILSCAIICTAVLCDQHVKWVVELRRFCRITVTLRPAYKFSYLPSHDTSVLLTAYHSRDHKSGKYKVKIFVCSVICCVHMKSETN